jgi:hypothetical protein
MTQTISIVAVLYSRLKKRFKMNVNFKDGNLYIAYAQMGLLPMSVEIDPCDGSEPLRYVPERTYHPIDYITDPCGNKYKKCCGNCSLWKQLWCDEGECMCKAQDCPRHYFADCEPCSYFESAEWPCFGLIK